MLCARHFEITGWIKGDDALPREPTHEAGHRHEPLPLGTIGQWTTALLAVVIQVRLVIQNRLPRDRDGLADAGPRTSLTEMAKLLGLAQNGLRAVVANGQVFEVTRN